MPPGDKYNDDYLCPLCKRRHPIRKCRRFLSMPIKEKMQLVEDEDICKNCLALSHRSMRHCPSMDTCHKCHKDHHTVMHYDKAEDRVVLEMTAMVYVAECTMYDGEMWRIKLNPSQRVSTVAAWSIYRFPSMANVQVYPEYITVHMWPRFPHGESYKILVCLKVVDQAMDKTPSVPIKQRNILRRVNKRCPADTHFWCPDYAPITLGADVAKKVFVGAPKIVPALPMCQCTLFGWTFFGNVKTVDIQDSKTLK